MINLIIARVFPGSFKGVPETTSALHDHDLIYYTFVTMTTLGYGDVSPARPFAKALAYAAAVTGQFYIAMLVGAVVGVYLNQRESR